MTIRLENASTPEQLENWARIMELVSGEPYGIEELTHAIREPESAWFLAYIGDAVAGSGVGRPSSISGAQYTMVRVLPDCRRQGVGRALLVALSKRAREKGRTSLWGRIREDDSASRRFADEHGFEEVGRQHEVILDLAAVDTSPVPPPGVEITTIAERPDLIQAAYDVDSEVGPDVPGIGDLPHEQLPFDRWHADYLEGPGAMQQALVVALVDDKVVGYAGLRRRGSDSPIGENMLTAVRRPWRRRGIATALKLAQIERARAAGIEQLLTTNDDTNIGMREVNKRLGYRPAPVEILVSGPLAT